MGYIYKITNKITNQNYIGQTTQDLFERWKQHKKTRSNCRYLKSAFNKYGIENFEFKLICICFDDDLNKLEINYIKKFNSLVPNGYNLRLGGENGGKHNEETKKKISETLKNKSNILISKPQLGKPHTEEVKNKISKALTGLKKKPETIQKMRLQRLKYKIFKIDKNTEEILETFIGYDEAAKSVGATKGPICAACNGKYKTLYGFIWKKELLN